MQPKYKDYKVISGFSDYLEFRNKVNYYLVEGYTLIGGVSTSISPSGRTYYAQAIAKLKEQSCQLTLS